MGMNQPVSPLWGAITKIGNPWPLDDETVAADLAAAWRGGGTVLEQGARGTGTAGEASLAAWTDPNGTQYGEQIAAVASRGTEFQQNLESRGAHAEYYSGELASAKTYIHRMVAQNEETFARLGNPLLGPAGPVLQAGFAGTVLAPMVGMLAEKADAIRGYPVDPDPIVPDPDQYERYLGQGSRELTPQETLDAFEVFGPGLKLGDVTLTDTGWLSHPGNTAITVDNTIYFPPGTLSGNTDTPEFQAWLMHELTHVYQYQHNAGIADLGLVSASGEYAYGGPQALREAMAAGKPFQDFNTEQQAEIVAQYYYGDQPGRAREYWRGDITGAYDPVPYKYYVDGYFPQP